MLVFGPAPTLDTPDSRQFEYTFLYLDLPTVAPGPDSHPRFSVFRCKPYWNPYDTENIPTCLPAKLSAFSRHSPDDAPAPIDHCDLHHISGHQLVGGRGCFLAVPYEIHMIGLIVPASLAWVPSFCAFIFRHIERIVCSRGCVDFV